ncbi:MAG: AI-2E family transporter [Actinomycetota bacterium]|nr:AI-2E family transporter [Actinomycetota bacterium]
MAEPAAPGATTAAGGRWPLLHLVSDVAWRSLVVAVAVLAAAVVLARLRLVVLPLFIAILLATVLVPLARWLERRGWRRLPAAWVAFGGFVLVLVGLGALVVPAVVQEFSDLGPVVSEGVDDVEQWLVDGPLGLEQDQIDDYREQAGDRLGEFLRSSSGSVLSGAVALVEGLAGAVLALVLTFFLVKDGAHFQGWALDHLPSRHHDIVRRCAQRAWNALSGFLRGAAAIGLIEAAVIGVTLAVVGGSLIVPVMVLTFLAAFFPVVGAVVAGIVAALVALVTGGPGDALIVAGVALAVQQFDNDLLAPFVYGRTLQLHPAVVLVVLTAGGTLGGIAGAFLAVPLAAVAGGVGNELWMRRQESAAQSP